MTIELINGGELIERGVTDFSVMRPVLARNQDPRVANATLRKDEWERVDERVNAVLRNRLTVVDDLRGQGLTEPVSIGTVIRRTERLSDMDDAEISFDGDTAPNRDRPDFTGDTRPVPVISKDFQINWRQLDASRNRGEPLDTTSAEVAARKVRDKIQELFANGLSSGGPTGGGIPGLTTATNRLTVALGNNWDTASGTPKDDVKAMLQKAYDNNLFGPFFLYVPKNYWGDPLQDDYKSESERTFIQRLEGFEDIEMVRPLDSLSDNNVILVQMTRDVWDLSLAQDVTTVQWEKNPFVTNFRVLAVLGPHIKNAELPDGTVVSGIVHLS